MSDEAQRFYGKYRGVVTSVTDPNTLGRIQVTLEAFPGFKDNWCMPCVPYAGDNVGFFFIPEVGAHVWIEFEGGDPSRPIWTGCYWTTGMIPPDATPTRKTLRTKTCTVVMDDLQGTNGTLEVTATVRDGVTVKMTMTTDGITLTASQATVTMSIDDGITIAFPNGSVALSATQIASTVGPTSHTLSAESAATTAPSISETATNEFSVSAGASTSVTTGSYSLSGSTLTLMGAAINIG